MRIYVASSWRNKYQPEICQQLVRWGHQVFDYRHPRPGYNGFHWSQIDKNWENWSPEEHRVVLQESTTASHGFMSDLRGMQWADACVLVLPCGRSAHLEAGWFAGTGKRLVVYMPEKQEPDLMYLLAQDIVLNDEELFKSLCV
jgi:hypothetical protein